MKPIMQLKSNPNVKFGSYFLNRDSKITRKTALFPIEEEKANEKSLWKAVIMQAVLDIMNSSARTENIVAKQEAISWFSLRNPNFLKVCEYADLNAKWVLKKVRFALKNPTIWRRPCDLRKFVFTTI